MAGQRDREPPPFFRRREEKRQREHECVPPCRDQDWLFEQAEKRLAAANEAIRTTRTYFFALLSIAAYIGVVIASTSDEQLLRISPVKLPIIGVEVPLTGFYVAVPWMFMLLHFNLLIHLGLTSKKLKGFLDDLNPLNEDLAERLRRDVANFPLAQWMVGKHDLVFHAVLAVMVWVMLVLIPPVLLLLMQARFVFFQDQKVTWIQSAAVAVDALLIVGFRAWFVRKIQPTTRWLAGAKALWKRRGMSPVLWMRLFVAQPLFRYLIPLAALGIAATLSLAPPGSFPLSTPETLLTRNTLTAEVVNALRSRNEDRREDALERVLGLPLQRRHLEGAVLFLSVLPKADLRGAKLQGADLQWAQLQGADLRGAQLQGANLEMAQLQHANLEMASLRGANLEGAQLQHANLEGAQLQDASLTFANLRSADLSSAQIQNVSLMWTQLGGADLRGAQLQGADLGFANLEKADLSRAQLQGADLRRAQLPGAILHYTQLQGADLEFANLEKADLSRAQLQGADLVFAKLQDAMLWEASLKGADLRRARIQGSLLWSANLEWSNLTNANLTFADLTEAQNLETAELGGADFTGAGLTGTFLDINQPPPDVVPASTEYDYMRSQCPDAEIRCVERVQRILER